MPQRLVLSLAVTIAAFLAAPSPLLTPMPGGHMFLLVANKAANTLGLIDPDSGKQIASPSPKAESLLMKSSHHPMANSLSSPSTEIPALASPELMAASSTSSIWTPARTI